MFKKSRKDVYIAKERYKHALIFNLQVLNKQCFNLGKGKIHNHLMVLIIYNTNE